MTDQEKRDAAIAAIAEEQVPKLRDKAFISLAFYGRGSKGLESMINISKSYQILSEVGDHIERLHFLWDRFDKSFFIDFLWFWFCYKCSRLIGGKPHVQD